MSVCSILRQSLLAAVLIAGACRSVLAAAAKSVTSQPSFASPRDTRPDTWAASDALGRSLPGEKECGLPRPGKFVGIFYFVWMDDRPDRKLLDISTLLAEQPADPAWGPKGAFHWWGKPQLGYYRSSDSFVVRRHAQMLSDAGVDVIIIDVTNGPTYDDAVVNLLRIYDQMRKEGNRTPQVAFISHARADRVVQRLYDSIYAKGLFPDLWFRWKGKPLILTPQAELGEEVRNFFTFRESWAWSDPGGWFGDGRDKWTWLDHYPQKPGWHESGKAEEVSVCVAEHPISNIGRSFAAGREPPPEARRPAEGACFAEQWRRALQVDPEFVFVTGWNEWIAQRFIKSQRSGPSHMAGRPLNGGDTYFVDTFSQEFSRDIEPMAPAPGGHGDDYYYQLVANVRRFKGVGPPAAASGPKTIDQTGPFAQWADVRPAYLDDIHDTDHRDHPGFGNAPRNVNSTGRNDFDLMKVARDNSNVYFYARTRDPISPPEGDCWMTLLIDADGNPATGWNGYDLIVNRHRSTDGFCDVEQHVAAPSAAASPPSDGWSWHKAGQARFSVRGDEIQMAFSRALLGPTAAKSPLHLRFKWTDNVSNFNHGPDPLDFIDKGDVAPNGRFNYVFIE